MSNVTGVFAVNPGTDYPSLCFNAKGEPLVFREPIDAELEVAQWRANYPDMQFTTRTFTVL